MKGERRIRAVKIGDSVTWGGCAVAETVVAVKRDGVEVAWKFHGRHFVAWDGFSHEPALRGIQPPTPDAWRLRFDNKDGDYVDAGASYTASLS